MELFTVILITGSIIAAIVSCVTWWKEDHPKRNPFCTYCGDKMERYAQINGYDGKTGRPKYLDRWRCSISTSDDPRANSRSYHDGWNDLHDDYEL